MSHDIHRRCFIELPDGTMVADTVDLAEGLLQGTLIVGESLFQDVCSSKGDLLRPRPRDKAGPCLVLQLALQLPVTSESAYPGKMHETGPADPGAPGEFRRCN